MQQGMHGRLIAKAPKPTEAPRKLFTIEAAEPAGVAAVVARLASGDGAKKSGVPVKGQVQGSGSGGRDYGREGIAATMTADAETR